MPIPLSEPIDEDDFEEARAPRRSSRRVEEEPPDRPGIVTTIAVCHFLVALVCIAVCVVSILLQKRGFFDSLFLGSGKPWQLDLPLYGELYNELDKGLPGHRILLFFDTVLSLAFAVLLVSSAIGLLQMRRWGRTLSYVFSTAALTRGLAVLVYALVFGLPTVTKVTEFPVEGGTQEIVKDTEATQRAGTILKSMLVVLPLVGMLYPLLSLLALARPSVSELLLPPEGRTRRRGHRRT